MPVLFLHRLTGPRRTPAFNRRLGVLLAFVAGAVNAGGFLAVHRYTSHMTGLLSGVADDLALGLWRAAAAGAIAVSCFVAGAMSTAMLTNWARRQGLRSRYTLPLMLEALLLLVFGAMGASLQLAIDVIVPVTVLLLCYLMGLQNAVITKVSGAQIRTTHMTGILTDIGIELGRWLYWNREALPDPQLHVRADRDRLRVLGALLGAFTLGAVLGALAFKHLGFASTLPLAVLLALVSAPSLWHDLQGRRAQRSAA